MWRNIREEIQTMKLILSLCRRKNFDTMNCMGFDLSLYAKYFRITLHVHSAELSLFFDAFPFSGAYIFPNYLRFRP